MCSRNVKTSRDMNLGKYVLPIGSRTLVMGILNVTPDSFSDGGDYMGVDQAVKKAGEMIEEGADVIDIGGESSRPGARPVVLEEELKRVIPVVAAIVEKTGVPVSVDTCKSEVARKALNAGAAIINDISALNADDKMADVISEFDAGVILMHMRGDPVTMQENILYTDVMDEILDFLRHSIEKAVGAGIDPDKIIVDPGIGFGKSVDNNLEILREIGYFKTLGKPILIGTSRKSFIGELTGRGVRRREFGTAATLSAAIMNGADIVRVHDVQNMVDVLRVTDAIKGVK